jgi:hypothetical protein
MIMSLKSIKGGRGHVAPYETTHARIPVPIKDYVRFVSDSFKQSVENGTDGNFMLILDSTVERISTQKDVNENKLKELARELVKLRSQRKSTKVAMDNLLTAILGEECK